MPNIDRTSVSTGVMPASSERQGQRDLSPRNLRRMIAVATVSAGLFILLGLTQATSSPSSLPSSPSPTIDTSRIRACRCQFDDDPLQVQKHGLIPSSGFWGEEMERSTPVLLKCMKEEASQDNCMIPLIKCIGKVWRQLSSVCIDQAAAYASSSLILSFSFYKQLVPLDVRCQPELTRDQTINLIAYAIGTFPCLALKG